MKAPNRFLINAAIEWILENDCTPHLGVMVNENTEVPMDLVEDGRIILNVNPSAVGNFSVDDDCVVFNSRFNGKDTRVFLPIETIFVVFSKENGAAVPLPLLEKVNTQKEEAVKKPTLSAVKSETNGSDDVPERPTGKPTLSIVK